MSDFERQEKIVSLLDERPFASVRDLQHLIGVSGATIRRDIEKLNEAGRARKVYGGVAAVERGVRAASLPFVENRDIAVGAKRAIAREAEKLVRDGSAIIIHGGSTCFHFGCRIANRNLRVFTNSLPLAAYLGEHGSCQLTVGGGDLHREPGILYDVRSDEHLFYAAQFFVGALGISEQGILEQHPLLVRLADEMSQTVSEVILLADSRKFSIRPPTVSLPFSRIARVVTDDGLADSHARMLERAGVEVIIAQTEREQ
ncbi:DeoR/GlpR family DNA-binding transcription regulator [Paracoccus sp. MBLB3053]|uniref:DeoR/GlpR family DNA-binding transcription regulator n=1 Tax=Paracoccus aurantius TaxID=3073814 RepID=A0ABU2HMD0_9RHOB|nr:DeoR/GlpR family DNA-binding transcription regulator [Paracoccus sp. MBLB3053]MDS9466195.1 DeoR/GlpR family DNA-binding transcription regulator [Paracoccus sp. MBLB3053]